MTTDALSAQISCQAGGDVDLHLVPAVPYRNPENYVHVSQRLADQLATTDPAGAVWANQFDNTANRDFHAVTTGPEIWNQTEGKVDGFVSAGSTGAAMASAAIIVGRIEGVLRPSIASIFPTPWAG